ncbi:hypothetical protein KEM48_011190 [Puccinia striiformis f. sp. tritici PST-130]|uniref:Rho-GAP domain-containing protein n=2 Tax=Puccinia striiformis f. sp. tritici TaxID=168172 RepID=A0A0L0VWV9_9BASI|nr:hypothetical protein KEM48_011190 [Puccinia striiformis f. sp. tritici PST-130]KNF03687.1 hypothetical protein PSTG_03208 [Puccinia striiformis f. sp. tritici PST-78]
MTFQADSYLSQSPFHSSFSASQLSLNPSPPPPLPPSLPQSKSARQPSSSQTIDFDEGVLRTLCGLECGFPLVIDRLKQAVGTSREVGLFLKKKSQLEEEYGIKLAKLAKERLDAYTHLGGEVKAGSFSKQYCNFLATHERIGIERTEYGARLNSISDELANLGKEVERVRKANKDVGWRLEKNLAESEGLTEKAKAKFDVTVEELERVLISRQNENNNQQGFSSSSSAGNYNSAGSNNVAASSNPSHPPSQPKSQAKAIGKAFSKLTATAKGTRSAGNLARLEDEIRARMATVSDAYRAQVLATQQVRQEYFNLQLPRILRTLKEHSNETDLAIQYYLSNYTSLSEAILVNEALSVSSIPAERRKGSADESTTSNGVETDNGAGGTSLPYGLKDIVQSIDNRADFKEYMANYAAHFNQTHHAQLASQSGPVARASQSSGTTHPITTRSSQTLFSTPSSGPPLTPQQQQQQQQQQQLHQLQYSKSMKAINQISNGESPRTSTGSTNLALNNIENKKTFGVDLATQMIRDGIETVPKVVQICIDAIEKSGGIDMVGIYRLSGTTSKIGRLKSRFDTDIDNIKLEVGDENHSEINDIAGAMKLWFRELPEPLLTWNLYGSFIEAGRIENNRLRHIRLHERVNELPDPNYATLKYLMGHLDKIRRNESTNSMGSSNLAVIFGPTLLSAPPINFYNHQQQQQQQSGNSNGPIEFNQNNNLDNNNNGILNPSAMAANSNALQDMSIQCKVVETILEHYREIFVDEGEEDNEDDDLTSGTGGLDSTGGTGAGGGVGGGGMGSATTTTTAASGSSQQNHSGHVNRPSDAPLPPPPDTTTTNTVDLPDSSATTPTPLETYRLSRNAPTHTSTGSPHIGSTLPSLPGEHSTSNSEPIPPS